MFEHYRRPLAPRKIFIHRILFCASLMLLLTIFSLTIGILGYHYFAQLSWIDSLLNAAMILSGMGEISELTSFEAKLFASFYAIFAGTLFLVGIGILIAPVFHRFLHKFHLEGKNSN